MAIHRTAVQLRIRTVPPTVGGVACVVNVVSLVSVANVVGVAGVVGAAGVVGVVGVVSVVGVVGVVSVIGVVSDSQLHHHGLRRCKPIYSFNSFLFNL